MKLWVLFLLAALARLMMIGYGVWHDQAMDLKYTDIDYKVFTEGAQHVLEGKSPYLCSEYKYTPILAYMLTPIVFGHELYGKVLFAIFDLAVGYVILASLHKLDFTNSYANILVGVCWLLNPLSIGISTRGSADSIQALLVVSMIFFLICKKFIIAGLLFGLSVHFKLYPIIYGLPIVLYIGISCGKELKKNLLDRLLALFAKNVVVFILASILSFGLVTALAFIRFGNDYLNSAFYYHMKRLDLQHNFSPYFYLMRSYEGMSTLPWVIWLAFVPQLILTLFFGLMYFRQLPAALFLQTLAFVSLNKVCTSQYFLWYVSLFPIAYPFMKMSLKKLLLLVLLWIGGQGIWLALAYELEYRKGDVLVYVWFASLLFLFINCVLLLQFADAISLSVEEPEMQNSSPVVRRKVLLDVYTPYGSRCLPCQGIHQRRSIRTPPEAS